MRKENWPQLLAGKISECRSREFQYGAFDCFLFAAECVEAITGIDHAAEFRGYDSKIEAYKIIANYGSVAAMVTAILGADPKPVAFAQRGDVVVASVPIADGEFSDAVGICDGVYSWFAAPTGLQKFRTIAVGSNAWSIG
jgi:hypothetical protein